jgi:signal transduction histidine kinase
VVNAVVPHVASVLYGRGLAAELDAERGRAAEAAGTERERIRTDLHDGLGPSLSGISLGLQAVDTAMTGQQRTARTILARTRAEADSAVREVRRVVDALGPDALAGRHLPRAIRDVADRLGFDGREGPAFEVRAHELGALPAEVEQVAYRIAGEALHNAARHARASRCVVTVGTVCDALELCVSDDGVGIDPASGLGVGLDSMRGRARAFGGTCTVASRPSTGTVVSVRIPMATP